MRYIVTGDQLYRLARTVLDAKKLSEIADIEAECRLIGVPDDATHFAWMKMESTSLGMQPWYYKHEEIPK